MSRPTRNAGLAFCATFAGLILSGCITSRVEDARESVTGIEEGEAVVIMAKSYHLGNETEAKYIRCIEDALSRGSNGLRVIPHKQFVDSLFPWFEPRTAPAETKGLPKLGGGGCFGFAWWQNDADYNAAVWDLKGLESAGSITADVSGTSFLPALVVPIPLIARAQAAACKGLAEQLRTFIVDDPGV
jgi:hypothetical protein